MFLACVIAQHRSFDYTSPDIPRLIRFQAVPAHPTMFGRTPINRDADQIIPLSTLGDSTRVSMAARDSRMSQATLAPPPPPELLSILPSHWNRIKPSGQAYLATENVKMAAGPFSMLPDELIIRILEYLDILSVLRVGSTCKALWAFSRLDEPLWRSIFMKYAFSSFVPSCQNLQIPLSFHYIVLVLVGPRPFIRTGLSTKRWAILRVAVGRFLYVTIEHSPFTIYNLDNLPYMTTPNHRSLVIEVY